MLTVVSTLLALAHLSPAHAGARKEASDAARAAIEDATRRGPAASAAEIPALSNLLEKAGWTPTPELSGVFRPGSIFAVMGDSHALLAEGCISKEPQENTYTSAEMVSSMQAGVSVRAGVGKVGVSGGIVKKVKFSTPVHLSVPIIDLQLSAACFARLESLSQAQRDKAYVVRELLRAEIAEQTCGRLNAEGRMVGLGSADAELTAACMQASLEPVGVGYRTVPLSELLAMGAAPEPEQVPPTAAADIAEPAAPEPAPEPESTGPFAIVFTEKDGSCDWTVEDLPSGEGASLFASSACPTEMVWKGETELYFEDSEALFLLRPGSFRAQKVERPVDSQCDDPTRQEAWDDHWEPPRLDRTAGEIRWACWVDADSVTDLPGDGRSRGVRVCAGDVCAEDTFAFASSILYKDYALSPEGAWKHVDTYVDCIETEGCGYAKFAPEAPLAPPDGPVKGAVSMGMLVRAHDDTTVGGCDSLPEELKEEPTLEALLKTGEYFQGYEESSQEYAGCPLGEAGFAFWVRHWPIMSEPSRIALGPVVLCDAACRRRVTVPISDDHTIKVQAADTRLVVGPAEDGSTVLLDGRQLAEERRWLPNQKVLVLPEGTPTPLGIKP